MSSLATAAACVTAAVAVGGAGYSIYSSQESASAQKGAAASNAYLGRRQAEANAEIQKFQADLNYKTAIAEAQQYDTNAAVYHQSARSTEQAGFQQENRMVMQGQQANSATQASYGSSGVTADSGSPLVVQAYQGGIQQLQRMDQAYNTNLSAMNADWQGSMNTYQATLTRETAKQFEYAGAMADWSGAAGLAGVGVQQQQANNAANATITQGYSSAIAGIGSAASSIGSAAYYSSKAPSLLDANAPGRTANGQVYYSNQL